MKFSKLALYIGIAILAFWVVGLLLKIAGWLLQIILVVGLIIVIASLINQFLRSRDSTKKS